MAERACQSCGRRFYPRTGTHRYCTTVCRERARTAHRPPRTRYGYRHQQLRKRVALLVATGKATCARCGESIAPTDAWDLDHADGSSSVYLGPSHAACNRSTNRGSLPPHLDPQYADDPERGIFWAPPRRPGDKPTRTWSRAWYDWRSRLSASTRTTG